MMKMTILAPRRPDFTHEQFRAYLMDVHAPLVRSITEVAADIRRYVYNFPVAGASDTAFGHPLADLDVVTQGTFDSREAQLKNMEHPRFMTHLRPDEGNFADTARALMHYTDQVEIIPGPDTPLKIFWFRRRRDGLDRHTFQTRWAEEFPAALAGIPGVDQVVSRYTQNHVQAEANHPDGANPKFYDVIDELWLSGLDGLARLGADDRSAATISQVESSLLETSRTRALVTESIVNIG